MKLRTKLPLTVAAGILLMFLAALFGLYNLNAAVAGYAVQVRAAQDHAMSADGLQIQFKTQVQEWKNTLLRGEDTKQRDKYWGAFTKLEGTIQQDASALLARLPDGAGRVALGQFVQAHAALGRDYRAGLQAFQAAGFNPAAGDHAVKGKDRAPSEQLDAAVAHMREHAQAAADAADQAARRAIIISLALMAAAAVASVGGGMWVSRGVVRQLGGDPAQAIAVARNVAAGDLCQPIVLAPGDTTSLMAHLGLMRDALNDLVGGVRENADGVATASAQIAQGNQDLSGRTEQQASALQQTAASMEQLGATVRQNTDSAQQANQLATGASQIAMQGGDVVDEVVQTMRGINDSARKIADIIGVIDGIAFQTNILALNAAVEAARAGEQGRGFAVVASEVRSLAGRSAEAAREIKALIANSVERVDQGTTLVDRAGATMQEVVASIRRVSDLVGEISSATTEQGTGMAQVGQAVGQMDQATQQNAALVEQTAAAAESLHAQAQQLVRSVAAFKLKPRSALAA
ncbi:MAG: chemotaxis protein [Burkholderiales bacterium RIFCSPHIGHO2_12_FULL_69_20]|nr:MAG: chemotaxis protein [Burkholderiales bacterium RIFCSPHIGHO2_12_FULL_69_20]